MASYALGKVECPKIYRQVKLFFLRFDDLIKIIGIGIDKNEKVNFELFK